MKKRKIRSNPLVLTGIIGWDTSAKKIKSIWFSSFGDHSVTYLVPEGKKLVGARKQTYRSGRTDPHEFVWNIGEDGSLAYESTNLVNEATGRIEFGPTQK